MWNHLSCNLLEVAYMKKMKKTIAILCMFLICIQLITIVASAKITVPSKLPTLRRGEKSNYFVKVMQMMLVHSNGADLDCTGTFGSKTEKEVKKFQKKYDLDVDGIVGPKTWSKLLSKCKLKENDKNDLVKLVQTILNEYRDKNGVKVYYCGKANGVFNSSTKKAVKLFQKEIIGDDDPTGIVDAKTWRYLLYFACGAY